MSLRVGDDARGGSLAAAGARYDARRERRHGAHRVRRGCEAPSHALVRGRA